MPGLGLQNAYGVAAMQEGLRQRLSDQILRQKQEQDLAIQLREQALKEQTAKENAEWHRASLADLTASRQAANEARLFTQDQTLNESTPPGTELSATSPLVGRLMPLGALAPKGIPQAGPEPPAALAALDQPTEIPGSVANAPMIQGRLFRKLPTQKQIDVNTDNARQAQATAETNRQNLATVARQTAADAEAARHNKAMEGKPPSGESFQEWQRKWDYEVGHPKPGAGGGTQGLQQARAESAAQMLGDLRQVHTRLNSGEGPGQLARGAGQKILGYLNLDNDATEYRKRRLATAIAIAVAIQGSRPSDKDAEAMAALLPDYDTPQAVAKNLFDTSLTQLGRVSENMAGGRGRVTPSSSPTSAPAGPPPSPPAANDPLGIRRR